MLDVWMPRKAEEIGCCESNNFFAAIKAVSSPPAKGPVPILSTGGIIPKTEKSQIVKHWGEKFIGVLNRPSTISDAAIDRLPTWKSTSTWICRPVFQNNFEPCRNSFAGIASGPGALQLRSCCTARWPPSDGPNPNALPRKLTLRTGALRF
ncbi:unnamed protein product [Dibothriocephalus latus]|uniref:Uncharacterized protein n=1 Tax=Dibothriocephalus latus TaxID=60516 RepID=A0A3P6PYK4_DIBLA|nr:unnamed protein product [Dibothriocephalus latus]